MPKIWTIDTVWPFFVEKQHMTRYRGVCDRNRGLSMRRVIAAAMLLGATSFSAPAYATDQYLVRFCEGFLDRYETVLASYRIDRDAGHRVHLARYHYFQHLRRKLRRTAQFCEHLVDSHQPPVSPAAQTHTYSYIAVRR